jgi:hypothetical protein
MKPSGWKFQTARPRGLDSCHERDERPDEAAGSSQNELVASAANTRFLTVEPIDLPLPLSGVLEISTEDGVLRLAISGDAAKDLKVEPPRDCRRPFGLSYAAMAGCSSMAWKAFCWSLGAIARAVTRACRRR